MKKCNFCSEEIQDLAKKCRFCWEWIDDNAIETKSESQVKKKIVSKNINSDKKDNLKNNGWLFIVWPFIWIIIIFLLNSIIQFVLSKNSITIDDNIQIQLLVWNALKFIWVLIVLVMIPSMIYWISKINKQENWVKTDSNYLPTKKTKWFYFTLNWRIWRLEYLWVPIITLIICIIIIIPVVSLIWILWLDKSTEEIIIWFFWFPLWIIFSWIFITTKVKRLHDLDKNWWWTLIFFIPIINWFYAIYLLFFKWTIWDNQYWPDPL